MLTSDNEGSTDEPASAARLAISRVFIYSSICFLLRRAPPTSGKRIGHEGGEGGGEALLFHFSKERENLHAREFFFPFFFFFFILLSISDSSIALSTRRKIAR